jgi:hypothetical protein
MIAKGVAQTGQILLLVVDGNLANVFTQSRDIGLQRSRAFRRKNKKVACLLNLGCSLVGGCKSGCSFQDRV